MISKANIFKVWCILSALFFLAFNWPHWGKIDIYDTTAVVVPRLIFSSDLTSSVNAEIGANKVPQFARASTRYYADTSSTLAVAASGEPAIGSTIFGSASSATGWQVSAGVRNRVLYSEDFSQAEWVASNSNKTTGVTTSPDGVSEATDIITATANDGGVSQDTGVAAASLPYCFFVWVKTASGTVSGKLHLRGVGGVPEDSTQAFTATTSWQKVPAAFNVFTAAATGNVTAEITIDTNGEAIYVWGAMAYDRNDEGTYWNGSCQYVETGAATAADVQDQMWYDSSNWTARSLVTGTLAHWYNPFWESSNEGNGTKKHMWDMSLGTDLGMFMSNGEGTDHPGFWYNEIHSFRIPGGYFLEEGVWGHWVSTWQLEGGIVTWIIYKNGAEVCTNVIGSGEMTVPTAGNLMFGQRGDQNYLRGLFGVFGRVRIYEGVLDSTGVLNLYNKEKGYYGL